MFTMESSLSFKTVLIANRGEIACRLMKTCHRLGLTTVAVYSDADISAKHVSMADKAVRLGPAPSANSYLNINAIIKACRDSGATAVLPGYGFLSENIDFVQKCEENNITFIGPTSENMSHFALKHKARDLALSLGVPLPNASPLLNSVDEALHHATRIGYPVMVKSTAGGGGIGMSRCDDAQQLRNAFDQAVRLATSAFGDGGVYIEKYITSPRHVEVQVFGGKNGRVICLGERECSIQRRHQKVIEETPSPFLTPTLRQEMCDTAVRLCKHINYQSAGTVEFVVDSTTAKYYFLEVNTRLQVEHGITEAVSNVDIVEWMIRLSGNDPAIETELDSYNHTPFGHSIECRIYAEDPAQDFRPCTGVITGLDLPTHPWVRYDSWLTKGTNITAFYDPLLMKVIVHGETRPEAIQRMIYVLSTMQLSGFPTNKDFLLQLCKSAYFRSGETTTSFCSAFEYTAPYIEVVKPGTYSSYQNWPGRLGLWSIGVPPSGPMDNLSLRIANKLVGNIESACGIEMTIEGMTLRIHQACTLAITGAPVDILCNEVEIPQYQAIQFKTGDILRIGKCKANGIRIYLAVAGGFQVPEYLGSSSTFPVGKFGGLQGRLLAAGDVLPLANDSTYLPLFTNLNYAPVLSSTWSIGVLYGPHGAPDFLTEEYMETFWRSMWTVHHNSNRLGIRLIGPKPRWARKDGGEAGLHPSNIHDCEYAIGSVNFTGDHPVILSVDGPSLGGFVCPVTIAQAELWKMGQVKPGDKIQFVRITHDQARDMRLSQNDFVESIGLARMQITDTWFYSGLTINQKSDFKLDALLDTIPATDTFPKVEIRAQGDASVLIEYGKMVLDIDLRLCVWMFMQWIDEYKTTHPTCERVEEQTRGSGHNVEIHLPNLGIRDVYLNAPCAVPINPQHRLVTSKFSPARTFTPEGAVGLGGAYLCIYGMESPGGYQLVGRTLPIWNNFPEGNSATPHLFRFFDKIQFYHVSDEELEDIRTRYKVGEFTINITNDTFNIAEYHQMLKDRQEDIQTFKDKQHTAFKEELQQWVDAGMIGGELEEPEDDMQDHDPIENAANVINATIAGSVWKMLVKEGDKIEKKQVVAILESMKMEFAIESVVEGQVVKILKHPGHFVNTGDPILLLD
ncbi:uncharacterized protein [Amphiura filiformis]|uniref:uncharacterized protein n=1 Tax=Amphiura filiformis TaxID=82378 RepID=UPI003B2211F2